MTAPEKAIEVEHLTKRFGALKAIDNVSFSVNKGQVVGFLGPNGAGKSTTMRILCGLTAATSGVARICGIPVASRPEESKRRIGYMPERNPLPEDMRVIEYLRYRARLKELPRKKLKSSVDEAMDLCDLNRKARKRVIGALSKGFRQRIGIADAILGNPEVIIMDEPTIGLDPHQILGIRRLINNLRGKMSVVLSSHILPEIELCCDQAIIINQGRIVAQGTSENLRAEFIPQTTYRVNLKGNLDLLPAHLKKIDSDISIQEKGNEGEDGFCSFTLKAPSTRELNDKLIQGLQQAHEGNRWQIREIAHLQPNLEDIFMAATRRSWDETMNGSTQAPFATTATAES